MARSEQTTSTIPWSRALTPGLLVGFAVTVIIVIATLIVGFTTLRSVYDTSLMVAQTYSVKASLQQLLATTVDAETGQRGFLITGATRYLEPYDRARTAIPADIAQIRTSTADNPEQQADLARLSSVIDRKLIELAETIRLRREVDFRAAEAVVESDQGKRTMDEMRSIIARMEAREDALLTVRTTQAARHYGIATATRLTSSGLALLSVIVLFFAALRFGADRERAARTAERLQVTLASIGDAVIATDDQGRVTHLNAVAEALTGWTQATAVGQRLEDVFVIVNEESRQPVESPIDKVLRDKMIVGLANHTVLISKDGRDIPIDDSAAPIKTAHGLIVGIVLVFRDVTERRRAEREGDALFELKARVAAIVESSDDAIVSKDLQGIIQSWNRGAEQLFGYKAAEVIGKPVSMLAAPERLDEMPKILERIARGESIDHYESKRRTKDGRVLTVSLTISPIKDASGKVIGASKVARDISEQKRAEELNREARRLAEDANRAKDQFLAIVSHELRNPLSAILGWSAMLRRGTLAGDRRERALEALYASATHQAKLIDELLDVSRIMSGKLRLERTAVDLPTLVDNALNIVRPAADEKGIHITTETDPSLGPFYADLSRLQQILVNLLSNAVKFTPAGGAIEVRIRRTDEAIELVVADTGQGISAEFLSAIFEPFRQVEGATTRIQGGLGLGLSIVRHLVEAHGGTVSALSGGEGRGSTFTVRLPIVAADHMEGGGPDPSTSDSTLESSVRSPLLHGISVLVVDDDANGCELLAAALEDDGAVVLKATSARQALDILQEATVQVLVADIAMPGEDGYSLIRKIRELERPGAAPLPAIALTSFAREEDRQAALQAGFQRHLTKPIDPRSLVAAVAALVTPFEAQ